MKGGAAIIFLFLEEATEVATTYIAKAPEGAKRGVGMVIVCPTAKLIGLF